MTKPPAWWPACTARASCRMRCCSAGPRGIGKATFAYHVAHHLLTHPASRDAPDALARPDPATPLFRQMAMGAHPAILHLTRPFDDKSKKFKTVLTVEEIRRVSRFLSMTSHDGSYRVIIVDPADDMNTNAANALLKNLEEPPARTIFMLIAHSEGALLPTIRSRCQMIRLSPLDDARPCRRAARCARAGRPRGDGAGRAAGPRRGHRARRDPARRIWRAGDRRCAAKPCARRPDVAGAHKLAEVVAARGEDIRFDIFNENALDLLSEKASAAARSWRPGAGAPSRGRLAGGAKRDIGYRHLQSRQKAARADHDRTSERRDANVTGARVEAACATSRISFCHHIPVTTVTTVKPCHAKKPI